MLDPQLIDAGVIMERMEILPPELLVGVNDPKNMDIVALICADHHLNDADRIMMVQQLTAFVLMGFIHDFDLGREINNALELHNPKLGDSIAEAVSAKIFAPIKEFIAKNYRPVAPPAPEVETLEGEFAPKPPRIVADIAPKPVIIAVPIEPEVAPLPPKLKPRVPVAPQSAQGMMPKIIAAQTPLPSRGGTFYPFTPPAPARNVAGTVLDQKATEVKYSAGPLLPGAKPMGAPMNLAQPTGFGTIPKGPVSVAPSTVNLGGVAAGPRSSLTQTPLSETPSFAQAPANRSASGSVSPPWSQAGSTVSPTSSPFSFPTRSSGPASPAPAPLGMVPGATPSTAKSALPVPTSPLQGKPAQPMSPAVQAPGGTSGISPTPFIMHAESEFKPVQSATPGFRLNILEKKPLSGATSMFAGSPSKQVPPPIAAKIQFGSAAPDEPKRSVISHTEFTPPRTVHYTENSLSPSPSGSPLGPSPAAPLPPTTVSLDKPPIGFPASAQASADKSSGKPAMPTQNMPAVSLAPIAAKPSPFSLGNITAPKVPAPPADGPLAKLAPLGAPIAPLRDTKVPIAPLPPQPTRQTPASPYMTNQGGPASPISSTSIAPPSVLRVPGAPAPAPFAAPQAPSPAQTPGEVLSSKQVTPNETLSGEQPPVMDIKIPKQINYSEPADAAKPADEERMIQLPT